MITWLALARACAARLRLDSLRAIEYSLRGALLALQHGTARDAALAASQHIGTRHKVMTLSSFVERCGSLATGMCCVALRPAT
jgi:hypothetical protein